MEILTRENGIVKKNSRTTKPSPEESLTDGRPIPGMENRILAALPEQEYRLLEPYLERVTLRQYEILHESGGRIDFTYFLEQGIVSLVALNSDGRSVEVG